MSKAFVCSGGGCKGAWEAGVISQLCKKGIRPDAVYGTSAGALNAAGYSYLGENGLQDQWFSIKGKQDVLSPAGIEWLWKWPRIFYAGGIHTTEPLRKYIERIVKGTPICKAVVCSVDLVSGRVIYTDNSNPTEFAQATRASCTIPLIMEPIGNQVDGGVREQTPLSKAVEDGYDEYYVILANPIVPNTLDVWAPPKGLFKWYRVLYRAVDSIMCHEIFLTDIMGFINNRPDLKGRLHFYAPEKQYIDTLEFDPEKIAYAFRKGTEAQEVTL